MRQNRRLLLLLFGLLLFWGTQGIWAKAQEPIPDDRHPIDKALDACMEKNPSTAGMIQCLNQAQTAWDKELNTQYQKLLAELDSKGKAVLRTAQRSWLVYRDAEYKSIGEIYRLTQGTMFLPMAADDRMDITRKRAKQLKEYVEVLKMGKP
jgi:uncharacterized protein YecT (DUF1311 family)